jgi:formiminoglutamase
MPVMIVSEDPNWARASSLLASHVRLDRVNVGLLGVPTFETSLTPREPCATPRAVRDALARYSTWSTQDEVDLADVVSLVDYGDVDSPDSLEGHRRVAGALQLVDPRCELLLILGGDNALTHTVMRACASTHLSTWGLVTLDAHHDLRDGASNGSPVRELLDAGVVGDQVAQVGIADFANSAIYAQRARDAGITTFGRDLLRHRTLEDILDESLAVAGSGRGPIYVDVDLDVGDRSVVPACPAAMPGGLSADELRRAVRHLASSPLVKVMDFTEVDARRDTDDQRTVRLMALLVLEAVAGVVRRGS